jgi:putative membrane protein
MTVTTTEESSTTATAVDQDTQQFMKEAASDGMLEVKLGKMAQEKASSDAVKQFGERMVQHHTQANKELMQLASQKGVTVPSALMPKHQQLVDKLSGEEFDRTYMAEMVKDHSQAVQDFEKQAETAQDPDVKAFAAKTLRPCASTSRGHRPSPPKRRAVAKSRRAL